MRRFAHGFCNSISHSHRYNLYRSFRRNREVGKTLCLAHNWVHDCGRGYFYHIAVCHNEGATMQSIETHPEIRLFCDLDHTLIYSHRVPIALNKIVVEYLNGKEQSYMTQGTYEFLCKQNCVHLIPVTTRSKTQYERISVFHKELCCKYALICNGGVLLVDGIEDPEWYSETLSLISPELSELQTIKELAQQALPKSCSMIFADCFFTSSMTTQHYLQNS